MYENYKLRPAEIGDCQRIYDIRNLPEIRRISHNQDKINFNDHKNWFTAALASKSMRLLVFGDTQILGVLRYDLKLTEANISLYIDPAYSKKGIGTLIYEWGEEWLKNECPSVKKMIAEILKNNLNSQKFFTKMGFMSVAEGTWEKKI